jgi:hypothetical protein
MLTLQATTSPRALTAVKVLMFVGLNTLLVSSRLYCAECVLCYSRVGCTACKHAANHAAVLSAHNTG